MKKRICGLLAALALLLAACGQPRFEAEAPQETAAETSAPGEITLEVLLCRYSEETEGFFSSTFTEGFEAANPGVHLKLELMDLNGAETLLEERLKEGRAPDVLNLPSFQGPAAKELLLPVDEYCPAELRAAFLPSLLEGGDGWALPGPVSAWAMYGNEGLLKQAGVSAPADWKSLEDCCRALKNRLGTEAVPLGLDLSDSEGQAAFALFAWGAGGGLTDDAGSWMLNGTENAEALTFLARLYREGLTNADPTAEGRLELQQAFAQGKIALLIAPQQLPRTLERLDSQVSASAFPVPGKSGGVSLARADWLMALRDEAAPDQAARSEAIGRFMSYFYEAERYAAWTQAEGFLPATGPAAERLEGGLEAWRGVLPLSRLCPEEREDWPQARQGIVAAAREALLGGDAQTLLDRLQAELTSS